MARIEEDQDQVREVHDVVGDAQGGVALLVRIEAGRIDEDLAPQSLRGAGLELQVDVDARAFPGRDLIDGGAHLIEGEARIAVQRAARQRAALAFAAEAQHRELVVYRLVAGFLQPVTEQVVEKSRLSGREGAEDGNHRPPRYPGGEGLVPAQHAELVGDLIELPEALHHVE